MLPPPLPPPAVSYFPPAAAYHLLGESEEWDMNAPTSAASVQSLAAAPFQLLGERGFRQSCQPLPRSHGGERESCSTDAAPAVGASGTREQMNKLPGVAAAVITSGPTRGEHISPFSPTLVGNSVSSMAEALQALGAGLCRSNWELETLSPRCRSDAGCDSMRGSLAPRRWEPRAPLQRDGDGRREQWAEPPTLSSSDSCPGNPALGNGIISIDTPWPAKVVFFLKQQLLESRDHC
ncbi:uncharacterized protein LOC142418077 isoform X6 [Mycteria americana]|uniref:uncharacterized protein LOC142418077 isoform X6 n=1 Tax=Mycteria americana TaxID=33587 RepID=UPI003F58BDA3